MPTIEMSSGFAAAIGTRMARLTDSVNSTNNPADAGFLGGGSNINTGFGSNAVSTHLYLMKGTMPTSATVGSVSSKSADILVRWFATAHDAGGHFVSTQTNVNPVVVSTIYQAAILTGTATWFWLVTAGGNTNTATNYMDTSATPHYSVIGTVGAPGSGADMEVPTTTIVLGEQYRVLNFRIQIPTSWTY